MFGNSHKSRWHWKTVDINLPACSQRTTEGMDMDYLICCNNCIFKYIFSTFNMHKGCFECWADHNTTLGSRNVTLTGKLKITFA